MTKEEQRIATWKVYKDIQEPAIKAYETSQEPAYKIYRAIQEPAWAACRAELERIDNEPEKNIIEVKGK